MNRISLVLFSFLFCISSAFSQNLPLQQQIERFDRSLDLYLQQADQPLTGAELADLQSHWNGLQQRFNRLEARIARLDPEDDAILDVRMEELRQKMQTADSIAHHRIEQQPRPQQNSVQTERTPLKKVSAAESFSRTAVEHRLPPRTSDPRPGPDFRGRNYPWAKPAQNPAAMNVQQPELSRAPSRPAMYQREIPSMLPSSQKHLGNRESRNTGPLPFAPMQTGSFSGNVTAVSPDNFEIQVFDTYGNYLMSTYTDLAGNYTTGGLATGQYYAMVRKQGYVRQLYNSAPCSFGCTVTLGTQISVTDGGDTPNINFAPEVGGTITGNVMDGVAALESSHVEIYSGGVRVTEGWTDVSGNYSTWDGLPTGTYYAIARKQGYLRRLYNSMDCSLGCDPTTGTSISVTAGSPTTVDFTLSQGGSISGNITHGVSPLQSINVQIYTASGSGVTDAWTDASGNYTSYDGLPSGEYLVRANSGQHYVPEVYNNIPCVGNCDVTSGDAVSVTAPLTTGGIDFDLDLGGSIAGTVTDESLVPLQNTSIEFYDSTGRWVDGAGTDASGNYTTNAGLPAGNYYVRVRSVGYLPEVYNNVLCYTCNVVTSGSTVTVISGTNTPGIDFALIQGGNISGRITHSSTGLSIGNAWINIYDSAGNRLTWAWTDPSGNYLTNDGLAAGAYYAVSSNDAGLLNELYDNLPCYFGCDATAGAPIPVTVASTVTGIDFALDPGGRISGIITDGSSPLSNANIQIYDSSGTRVSNASPDGSGVYVSREGLPNGNYFVRANAQGRIAEIYNNVQCTACDVTSGTPVPVTQGYTTPSINFALDEGGTISGTVTDAGTSTPLGNASISIMDSAGDWVASGYTDSSGSYVAYDGLPTGTYYVYAQAQSHKPEVYDSILCLGCDRRSGTPVAVTVGSNTGNIDFALESGGTISGTVTDASTSQPLANAWISIADSNGSWLSGTNTDNTGHYLSYDGLPSGNYFIRVSHNGHIPELYDNIVCLGCNNTTGTPVPVTDGEDTGNIDFALARGGTISGKITDAATTTALTNGRVDVYDSTGQRVTNMQTNATGDYVTSDGLPAADYFVRAQSQGYKPEIYNNIPCLNCNYTSGTAVHVTVGNNASGINFALDEGGTISGTITDAATSMGIANANVNIYDSFGNQLTYGYTDSSGHYAVYDGLPSGNYYATTWNGQGYMDKLYNNLPCHFGCDVSSGTPIPVVSGSDTGGINFALVMGGAISGTITDAGTLAPLSNAQIEISNSSGQHFRNFYTDSLGKYLANGLPSGSYYLKARKQGYQAEVFNNIHCLGCDPRTGAPISVTLGITTANINFALDVGGSIAGTITDFDTSLPLANANIEIINSSGNTISWANSDGIGLYVSSDGFPAGNYYVRASEQTHIRQLYNNIQCVSCNPNTGNPVAVTVGNTTSGINFVLHKGGNISGFITDEATGTPLQNTHINVYNSQNNWVTNAQTDNSGNYLIYDGLPTGDYFLTAGRSGYVQEVYNNITCIGCDIAATGDPVHVTVGATTGDIDFALSPGGSLSGTVVDAITSAPLANVQVAVFLNLSEGWVTSVFTDASGAYVASGELPTGTYYVRTWSTPDYIDEAYNNIPCPSGFCSSGTPVYVSQGSSTPNIDFSLTPGGKITGNITDVSTSNPVMNVAVQLFDSTGKQLKTASTNAAGSYEFRGLSSGSFYVRVHHSDYLSEVFDNIPCSLYCTVTNGTPVVVTAGYTTSDINFDLTPGGNISGTVTDSVSSAPLEGVLLVIYDSDAVVSQYAYAYTDAVGYYRSDEAFPDGAYRVQTSSQHYIPEMFDNIPCFFYCNLTTGTPVVISAAANATDIDFALTRGGTISGTVTNAATSLPVQGVPVRAYDASGNMMTQGNTNGSGHYQVFDGLPAGTYYVRTFNSPGYINELYNNIPCLLCDVTTGAPVAVTLGNDTPNIDFALNPGGSISGTVIDSSTSLPIFRALIQVFTSSGTGVGSARTDASGHFTARLGLTTGSYFVRASQPGFITEQYDNIQCLGCQATLGTAVPVTTGVDTPGINFALDRGGSVSGKVTDASNGAPLAFVEVDIISALTGYAVGSAITDSGGNYSLGAGLPSGTYWAQANWATKGHLGEVYNNIPCILDCDYSSATPVVVTAPATTPNIDFSLDRGTLLSGHVTDAASGLPLDGAQVQVFDSTGAFLYNLFTNANGEYQALDSLATGTYYALAVRTGYERELYNNHPCAGCDVTSGTPIVISAPGTVSGINFSLQPETAVPWKSSDVLNTGRSRHTATLLNNGKILVAGGFNGELSQQRRAV